MQPTDTTVFVAHFHIVDPASPLIPNDGYLPDAFTADDDLQRTRHLGITGGTVVSGSFQGTDQSYLIAALERLGSGFVGIRIDLSDMEQFARRVHDVAGWHSELSVGAADLLDLESTLLSLVEAGLVVKATGFGACR